MKIINKNLATAVWWLLMAFSIGLAIGVWVGKANASEFEQEEKKREVWEMKAGPYFDETQADGGYRFYEVRPGEKFDVPGTYNTVKIKDKFFVEARSVNFNSISPDYYLDEKGNAVQTESMKLKIKKWWEGRNK